MMSNTSEAKKRFLQELKMEAARELGRLEFVRENNDHYKGDVSSRQNGSEGGPIGGEMVRRMVQYAKNNISQI
ncbi:small acid-soluble spore protein alpha/beta type [Syntrophobotulus glycolicus DSM 8271]|uniref:Small acid-soluble spore protein alpha/beta type n=2 Tax=Syntrophobotulus TaxID=51196 RepID=F0T2U4_SYNGF|nr:small acid-soluble spore protein alpha/beta type [Syntrophobotulus glycolicus DSM 8271]